MGRALVLTEAGRIALDHANRIFSAGDELLATLNHGERSAQPLRVGALSTLSRNFQMQFLQPLLQSGAYPLSLKSGDTDALITDLETLALDVVLTTRVPHRTSSDVHFAAQRIAEQPVHLHGTPERLNYGSLAELLASEPLILPTDIVVRSAFENLVATLGVTPQLAANVDDMAMVRLLARAGVGVALTSSIVVADEIANGLLKVADFDLGISEPFFAVTLPREFPHPALKDLLTKQIPPRDQHFPP
ncbi:MAG: LysR family transcriptional regulator [Pseudomonadota bacterium]